MTVHDDDIERALTVLAEDVDLGERDVDAALTSFVVRSAQASRRRRLQRLAAASAAAVLLVGGAAFWAESRSADRLQPARPSATATSVISASDLVGVWALNADWISGPGWLWTFYADGTGAFSNNADTAEGPFRYSLRATGLGARDASGCDFSYRLTSYTRGTLAAQVNHQCGDTGPGISFVRLSPASPAGMSLPMPPMAGATPVREIAQAGGVWLMPGTGLLLAIDASDPAHATYALDDRGDLARNPRDSGVAALSADGTLTLTSTKAAPSGCSDPQGSRIRLNGLRVLPGKAIQAAGPPVSSCPRAPVQGNWIMVSAR